MDLQVSDNLWLCKCISDDSGRRIRSQHFVLMVLKLWVPVPIYRRISCSTGKMTSMWELYNMQIMNTLQLIIVRAYQPFCLKICHTYLQLHHIDSLIFAVKFLLQSLNTQTHFVHLCLQGKPLKTSIVIGMSSQPLHANTNCNHIFTEH
jgi:hypothetical protein